MEQNFKLYLPLNFNQLVELVKQLPVDKKQKLLSFLQTDSKIDKADPILTHFASEKTLAKDWLSPQEDEAWQDL